MTDTNQLPPHTVTINDHPEPHIMQWSDLELAAIKKYAESYALQARAQVQGVPFGYIHHFVAHDDSGAIIDTTWEADGCADALPHPTQPAAWKWSHATPFYTTPQPAQATQAEGTDERHQAVDQIMEQAQVFASAWALVGGRFDSGDALDDAHEAKEELREMVCSAILAMRPVQVPMTDEQRECFNAGYESAQQEALECRLPPAGWACTRTAGHEGPCAAVPTDDEALVKRGMDRLREAHHGITAQAQKGQP